MEREETPQPDQMKIDQMPPGKMAQRNKNRTEWWIATTIGWLPAWILYPKWGVYLSKYYTKGYSKYYSEGYLTIDSFALEHVLYVFFSFAAAGAFLGLLQWLVLVNQAHVRPKGWWILATAAGVTVGGCAGLAVSAAVFPNLWDWVQPSVLVCLAPLRRGQVTCIGGLVSGVMVGVAQWPVLISLRVPRAWRWLLSNILSGIPIIGGVVTGASIAKLVMDGDAKVAEKKREITIPETKITIFGRKFTLPGWGLPIVLGALGLVTLVWAFWAIDGHYRRENQAFIWFEWGRKHSSYQPHLAIAAYTHAIELFPNDRSFMHYPRLVGAYCNRGEIYGKQADYELAIADFTRAIELDPNYGWAYRLRAFYLAVSDGDLDQALADANRAIELFPNKVNYDETRGFVYYKLGEYDAALADYDLAIEKKSDFSYYGRGLIYEAMGEEVKALADYSRFPGSRRYAFDEPDPFLADACTRIEALGGECSDWAYYNRGNARGRYGDYQGAIADFTRAIELDPDYRHAYNKRAWYLALSDGDLDQALADANRAIELWALLDNFGTRGYVYYKLGDYDAALADYNHAIEMGSEFSYYGRGLIFEAQGEEVKALEDYKRFLDTDELRREAFSYSYEEPFIDDARARIEALEG